MINMRVVARLTAEWVHDYFLSYRGPDGPVLTTGETVGWFVSGVIMALGPASAIVGIVLLFSWPTGAAIMFTGAVVAVVIGVLVRASVMDHHAATRRDR